jgi:large subunit ribosomal protein L17
MRKRKKGRKLSRKRDQRKALLKSLARELFLREKIKTTEARAKELRSFAERFIERAKEKNLPNVRYLRRFFNKDVLKKLFEEIGPRYKERKGGYTRILKLEPRKSNGAKMAIIELVK